MTSVEALRVSTIYQTETGGNLWLATGFALLAGFLSFASPCVLPLIPGYLGFLGGSTEASGLPGRGRLILAVAAFVAGFSVVFIAYGWILGVAGFTLKAHLDLVTRVGGVLVIALGLVFVGRLRLLQRSVRPRWVTATGLAGAPVLGLVFGLGWTPCIGPTLGAVLTMASGTADASRGAFLGALFCVGLGVPFVLAALGFDWMTGALDVLRRHIRLINLVGGALLIMIGALMVSGIWQAVLSPVSARLNSGFVPLL
jgi:cytochrome c-type biogenesis protein